VRNIISTLDGCFISEIRRGRERTDFSDENWKKITLPRAFNEDEAFKVHIWGMTDTIA
jgi:beta-galactosidase